MAYQSFVLKRRFSNRGAATVATGATLPASATELSQVSQGLKSENDASARQTVADVATVARGQSQIRGSAEDLEERAALIEFGAGVPRKWAEGFARLDRGAPAAGFSDERWRQVIDDGGRFIDRWGKRAADLGWCAEDAFGAHPIVPASRYDQMGLVLLISGGEVVALTEGGATILSQGGASLTYRRMSNFGTCIWQIPQLAEDP